MFRLIPPALHRAGLRFAHRLRHRWRRFARLPIAGVTVIARDDAGRVLMVRHSYGRDAWTFPGGGIKRGEDPADAARREIREELGCDIVEIELLRTFDEVISGSPHTAYLFAARLVGVPCADRREVLEARTFDADNPPEPFSRLARRRLEIWKASKQG